MYLIFRMMINIKFFCKLISTFLVAIAKHAQSTQNNKFAISLQYLKKEGGGGVKLISGMQINTKLSYRLVLSILEDMVGHAQSTQNNKFVKSLYYCNIGRCID